MKRQITAGYVFTPASGAAAGTIDLSAVPGIGLGALLAVINVTRNQLLYVAGQAGYGSGGYSASNVLTLQASSQGHAAGDALQVILDDGANPALDSSVQALLTQLKATLNIAGTVTATGAMQDATGQSILAALKAQINVADLLVTDGTNYYVRREQSVNGALTVGFENMDGSAASPTVANLKPVNSATRVVDTVYFDVTAAGAATAVGDIVARVVITDTATQAIVASLWQNVTQGTTITAATAGTYVAQTRDITVAASALPANAAQEAGGNLAALATAFGSKTDAVAASIGAAASFVALFRLALTYLFTLAGAVANGRVLTAPQAGVPSATVSGAVSAAGSAVTLAVDGFAAASVQVLGTWSGTLTFQASPDGGTTYYPVSAVPMSGGSASAGTTTGNGWWELAIGGMTHLQVVAAAALTSGSATVALRATAGAKSVRVGTASGNPVQTTGTAVALADRSGTTSSTANANTGATAATAASVTVLAPANANRQFLRISNPATSSSTAAIYVYDKATGSPSMANSVAIGPGQSVTYDAKVPAGAIQVFSNAASIAYEAAEG